MPELVSSLPDAVSLPRQFLRALHAEALKVKRTAAVLLVIVAPFLVAMVFFVMAYRGGHKFLGPKAADAWTWLTGNALTLWAAVLLPMVICMVGALLADLETRGRQWKHLFALPLARGVHYAAKQTGMVVLAALALGLLTAFVWSAGRILHLLQPELGFGAAFPWLDWLRFCFALLAASGLLLAIHTWIGLRFESFVPGIALGFLGMSLAGILKTYDVWSHFPWLPTIHLLGSLQSGAIDWHWPLFGVLGGLAVAALGAFEFGLRDAR